MNNSEERKKKVIDELLKKKIDGLKGIYGGTAIGCTVPPKPIVVTPPTQCYICTVTPPKDPNGPIWV